MRIERPTINTKSIIARNAFSKSLSRVMNRIVSAGHQQWAQYLRARLAALASKRDLLALGAYQKGTDPWVDEALTRENEIEMFLRQRPEEHFAMAETLKALEALTCELLETALQAQQETPCRTARAVLQAAGRVRPLSESLRRKIIPGVTLDEVRHALIQAAGPTLSNIILEQRGPKV